MLGLLLLLLAQEPLDEVKARVTKGEAILVDVREQSEWDAGRLAQAKFVPLSHLRRDLAEAAKGLPKDLPLYLYCKAGVRSARAAELLKAAGYDARSLKQGYEELLKSGFPPAK